MIRADTCRRRSISCLALCASSSDLAIASRRTSSACSNGPHANRASNASRTRNVRMVQMKSPGSGWTRGLSMTLLQQHDQQAEHQGQNGNAFEQEQREVYRSDDL